MEVASFLFGAWVACSTAVFTVVLVAVWASALVLRPWDSSRRSHEYAATVPLPVFWFNSWLLWAAELVASLKPAPMRLAELASSFTKSQVLFALVNLGLPDLLAAAGPLTAQQLAEAINTAPPPGSLAAAIKCRRVNAAWLERLLAAAASLGMLASSSRKRSTTHAATTTTTTTTYDTPGFDSASDSSSAPSTPTAKITLAAPAATKQAHAFAATTDTDTKVVYHLNALTAALTNSSPANMSSFVKLLEYDCQAMCHLSQGLLTDTVPFEVGSGGCSFWDNLAGDEAHATAFDVGMLQKRHIGGRALVVGYPWARYDTVIDVAGGVGTFTADLLAAHPKLKAVVLDQQQQIARGKKIWASDYQDLLPRVELVAGDIFNSDTIPTPPEGSASVAYVLYDILHNWADASALAILRCIRQAVARGSSSSASNVQLLLLETTKSTEVLPCHLPFRCGSDIVMMTLFGDGCERDTAQFRRLLSAAGWRLGRLVPTNGIFMVLEATPDPHWSSSSPSARIGTGNGSPLGIKAE